MSGAHHHQAFAAPAKPFTDRGMRAQESLVANAARRGSDDLKRALLSYGVRYGLPNMSRLQCLRELQALVDIRMDELVLADRIERELGEARNYWRGRE